MNFVSEFHDLAVSFSIECLTRYFVSDRLTELATPQPIDDIYAAASVLEHWLAFTYVIN